MGNSDEIYSVDDVAKLLDVPTSKVSAQKQTASNRRREVFDQRTRCGLIPAAIERYRELHLVKHGDELEL